MIQFSSISRTLWPRGPFRITLPMTMLKPNIALQRLRETTRENVLASKVGYGKRWSTRLSGSLGRQMPFPFQLAGLRPGLGSLLVPSSQLTTALACCDVIDARSDMGTGGSGRQRDALAFLRQERQERQDGRKVPQAGKVRLCAARLSAVG